MKTNTIKKWATVIACACVVGVASQASAIPITPATVPQWSGPETSQAQINTAISGIIGASAELYKSNVGGSDEGGFAGSYETTYSNTPQDPADALIEYVGGPVIGPTAYLLVKDGNQNPGWYLFNLTALGWTGIEDLELSGFWPDEGSISHVAIYGTEGTNVPDGGSMLVLLGGAVTVLGFLRRKIAA